MNNQNGYQRGLLKLNEVEGEIGEELIEKFKDIAPDFLVTSLSSLLEIFSLGPD